MAQYGLWISYIDRFCIFQTDIGRIGNGGAEQEALVRLHRK